MPQFVPIPPEVWQRLAALDSECDARLERMDTASRGTTLTNSRNYARMWRVQTWRRADGEQSRITVEGTDLAGTLDAAVWCAEARSRGL